MKSPLVMLPTGLPNLVLFVTFVASSWRDVYLALAGEDGLARLADAFLGDAALRALCADPSVAMPLALLDARPSGTALARTADGVIIVSRLYVVAGARGRGLGPALLDDVAATFPVARRMRLTVQRDNDAALRFYRRIGFREAGAASETLAGIAFHNRVMER